MWDLIAAQYRASTVELKVRDDVQRYFVHMCFITIRANWVICRTLSQRNVNRGRVEKKRPTDEEIADYIKNSEPV